MKKKICRKLKTYDYFIRENCEECKDIQDNYHFISRKIKYAQKEIKRAAYPSLSHIGEIEDILKRYSFGIEENELYTELTAHNLSDIELQLLYPLIIFYCSKELYYICQGKNSNNTAGDIITFLQKSSYYDYDKMFTMLSKTEKQLLNYRDYRISDDKTRAQYRFLLSKYAKKRKLSEYKALRTMSGKNITEVLFDNRHRVSGKLYFPCIILTFLFFASGLAKLILIPFDKYALIPFLLTLFPLYECSVYLVNYSYSKLFVPFEKLSIRKEDIPDETKCAVVITSLLTSDDDELFSKLENYYVSNKRDDLVCGILADLPDSDSPNDEKDEAILDNARGKIKKLREKYGDVFYLFYRNREYSSSEGKFIASERKRGAVCELCRLLNDEENNIITYPEYDCAKLSKTKYLITLDSDTELSPGDAERMIRAAEHPYNIPEYDEKKHRVTKGHGILQPSVETSLDSSLKTGFSFLTSGAVGTQVYRYARFDVYSEIFNGGIFCGKGIINVDVFCKAVNGVFPKEKILSHDTPEGCLMNVGMISEITFHDSTPSNGISYYKRQNRWIRGDVQNLLTFTCGKIKHGKKTVKNPLTLFDKYKIFDNVRRDITPVFALLSMITGAFFTRHITVATAVFSLFYLFIPFMISSFECIVSGAFGVKRKYYSFTLSSFWYGTLLFLYRISTLAHEGYTSFVALLKGLWRYCFSNRHLLEWVSASNAEKTVSVGVFPYILKGVFSIILGIIFLFIPYGVYRFSGLCFILSPFLLYDISFKRKTKEKKISEKDKEKIQKYVLDMWRYFKDTVNEESGFLPPDNVTLVAGERVAKRTSPTNIGLYLLSALSAYDFALITEKELLWRIEKTIGTVEGLKKYKGNLYNWYDTETLCCLDSFVSFVDSGNFVCCLVALKEGIKDIEASEDLYQRINALIENTDLECMFDKSRNMFYIGIDEKNGVTRQNHYDIYMSEERTADHYATSRGIIGFGVMSNSTRAVISEKGHIGLASWTGTAFEYFMPTLFLPVFEGSLLYEAMKYAYDAQRTYTARAGNLPSVYGTSESCYYEFDTELDYQYKAHGVPSLGLKSGLADDLVISPYSSYLMLCMGGAPLCNLDILKEYSAYGKYGFYEAVDFTKTRVGDGYAVVKCFMAHHIGMSMVACANFVFDGIFQKRFTSDIFVKSSLCLLKEKIPTDTPVYKGSKEYKKEDQLHFCQKKEKEMTPYGCVSNSLCRCDLSKDGILEFHYGNIAISDSKKTGRLRFDVLKNGSFHNLIGENKGKCDGYVCEFNTSNDERCDSCAVVSVCDDKNVFCIECAFDEGGQGLFSFAPVLEEKRIYSSHVSYSRLFIKAKLENGVLILKRKNHPPRHDFYLALSVCDDFGMIPFEYEISSDKILPFEIERYAYDTLKPSWINTHYLCPVTPFVLIKTDKTRVKILLSCSNDEREAVRALHLASVEKNISRTNRNNIKRLYKTFHGCTYCDGDILSSLIEKNVYPSERNTPSSLDDNTLWKYGISGDVPVLTLDLTDINIKKSIPDELLKVIYTHKTLLIKGHRYDTAILYSREDKYAESEKNKLYDVFKKTGVLPLAGRKNGIFAVRCDNEDEKQFFKDVSFYPSKNKPSVLPGVLSSEKKYETKREYKVGKNGVEIINGASCVPWCFVYANERFGTLVTQNSLGFSWCGNSQKGKITNFNSDVLNPYGEEIYAVLDGILYPLSKNAEKTVFYFDRVIYKGEIKKIKYEICVFCDSEKERKYVRLKLTNHSFEKICIETAYTADFVLGEKAQSGRLFSRKSKNALTVVNAYNSSEAVLYCPRGNITSFDGEKGAVRCVYSLPASSSTVFDFTLGRNTDDKIQFCKEYTLCKKATDAYLDVYELDSGNENFDLFFNRFSKYQALYCRVYARCGFYQNSGAFGFRDQLQDMLCVMYSLPEYAREHILRCASHQYEQGDVAHWWHTGDKETGVRTRCSDDMLWLVYVCAKYIRVTSDDSVLFTPVPYISSPPLSEYENDRYEELKTSDVKESVYMHCVRAVECVKYGQHGLPLFGSGDWNDGMNNVGGESVWLSWFLYGVLCDMSYLARLSGDEEGVEKYEKKADKLREDIENFAYNGKYYIRGTFEDGTPLGIVDILPQTFAAMYGENKDRIISSLDTAWDTLCDEENKQLLLFYPPFNEKSKYAGYICDYPEGIRENGGQYTHGAIWGAIGFFDGGMNERGYELLCALNPLIRCEDEKLYDKYKGEPYVISGDIYSAEGIKGRCGWSWYTGAAGWYFTAVLEKLLGYKETGDKFTLDPSFCKGFKKFDLTVRKKGTVYNISSRMCKYNIEYPFDGKEHTVN